MIAIENTRLFGELQDSNCQVTNALEQQTALGDVLRVIASSPAELPRVFEAMAERAYRVCQASSARIWLVDGDALRIVGSTGAAGATPFNRLVANDLGLTSPFPGPTAASQAIVEGRVIHIEDTESPEARDQFSGIHRGPGVDRTRLHVPLRRDGVAIGAIAVSRHEVSPFDQTQIALLEAFADQAVIAIENARLFSELERSNADLRETLGQQTATAEILRVIATSPTNAQPVLDAIVESANRLMNSDTAALYIVSKDVSITAAAAPSSAPIQIGQRHAQTPGLPGWRAFNERRTIHIPDQSAPEAHADYPEMSASSVGARLWVPLLHEHEPIGTLAVTRTVGQPYTDREIALLETFADQAAIAIENAQLYEEVEQRNAELQESHRQVTEALEQQTATAEVLRIVASSPTDLDTVLQAILEAAAQLCDAEHGALVQRRERDGRLVPRARYGYFTRHYETDPATGRTLSFDERTGFSLSPGTVAGSVFLDRRVISLDDVTNQDEYPEARRNVPQWGGAVRSQVSAPLLVRTEPVGIISLYRAEVRPFSPRDIERLQMFADQAVIAIENARLFSELEQRNRELSEALEQQMATADILGVIASSPTDAQPVLDAIVQSAVRLSHGAMSVIRVRGEKGLLTVAEAGLIGDRSVLGDVRPYLSRLPSVRAFQERRTIHIADRGDPTFRAEYPDSIVVSAPPTSLSVPLIHEDIAIGVLDLYRDRAHPYSAREIALLETFADQAVIAIENARLFRELEQRTEELSRALEQQTAMADVLRVIAASPTDIEVVLTAICETAARLCEAEHVDIRLVRERDGRLVPRVGLGVLVERAQAPLGVQSFLRYFEIAPGVEIGRLHAGAAAFLEGRTIHVADVAEAVKNEYPASRPHHERLGIRTQLYVPLLRRGEPIGVLALHRLVLRPFTDQQIALVEAFADQAVVAIENARLFEALQEANA